MADSNYHDGKKREQCYFCNSGPPLREHHVIPQRFGGPDTDENIVELCDLCHTKIERLYDKSFYEWFGINDTTGRREYQRPCDGLECNNRRRVKVNTIVGIVHAFQSDRGWQLETARKGVYDSHYLCRPCAARVAKMLYDGMTGEYNGRIRGDLKSVEYNPGFESAQEVLDEMIRDSTDD